MKYVTTIIRLAAVCALTMPVTHAAAAPGNSADELLSDAERVFQQFDSERYADAWQNAAPFIKAKIPRDQFVNATSEARRALGAIKRRGWSSVTRIQFTGAPDVPDGLYANVDFTSTLADGRTVFELLSFQLGTDGQWHLTGYRPRLTQDATTAAHKGTP